MYLLQFGEVGSDVWGYVVAEIRDEAKSFFARIKEDPEDYFGGMATFSCMEAEDGTFVMLEELWEDGRKSDQIILYGSDKDFNEADKRLYDIVEKDIGSFAFNLTRHAKKRLTRYDENGEEITGRSRVISKGWRDSSGGLNGRRYEAID